LVDRLGDGGTERERQGGREEGGREGGRKGKEGGKRE
jgi:hypothetical protein